MKVPVKIDLNKIKKGGLWLIIVNRKFKLEEKNKKLNL